MRYFILDLNRQPVSCTRDVWRNTYPHCGTISRRLSYLAEDVELHTTFHSCTEAENDPPCLWETTSESVGELTMRAQGIEPKGHV